MTPCNGCPARSVPLRTLAQSLPPSRGTDDSGWSPTLPAMSVDNGDCFSGVPLSGVRSSRGDECDSALEWDSGDECDRAAVRYAAAVKPVPLLGLPPSALAGRS